MNTLASSLHRRPSLSSLHSRLRPQWLRPYLLGALLLPALAVTSSDAQAASVQTVDSAGDVGLSTSQTLVETKPAISYYDNTNGDLKYAINSAADGSGTWNTVTVDSGGDVGRYTSLAVVNGKPAIAYWDVTNGKIKFAISNNTSGTGTWTTTNVEDTAGTFRANVSLAVVDGRPAISFDVNSTENLKYTINSAADGTGTWNTVTVDSNPIVGFDSSLEIVNGKPAISYWDALNNDLKFATSNTLDGNGSWSLQTIDGPDAVGENCSLAIVNGKPAISYYDNTNFDLKFAINSAADGTGTWTVQTVDTPGFVGFYTSLAVFNGKPAISYADISNGLKFAVNSAADGSGTWAKTVVESGSNNGFSTSLVVVNGKPSISYYDSNSDDLKWAVVDVDGPTALSINKNTVLEGQSTGSFVGSFITTDPNAGETFTYSLVTGAGDNDNASFSITGPSLRTDEVFNASVKSSYNIRVRSTDSTGLFVEAPFVITVLEATKPTVTISTPAANAKILQSSFVPGSITGTAADNVGVTKVQVRLARKRNNVNTYWNGTDFITTQSTVLADLTGGNWNLTTSAPPLAKLDAGLYSLQVAAIDAAGNKSTYVERSFTLIASTDTTAPTVAISTPTASQVVDINALGAGTLTGTASDDTAVTSVKIKLQRKRGNVTEYWNGTDFTPTVALVDATYASGNWSYPTPIPANKLDKGGYTLYATAYDAAGNFKTSPSRIFYITGNVVAPDAPSGDEASSAGRS